MTGQSTEGTKIAIMLKHYPDTQTSHLFGSQGTEDESPDNDVDGALLPPTGGSLDMIPLRPNNLRHLSFPLAKC